MKKITIFPIAILFASLTLLGTVSCSESNQELKNKIKELTTKVEEYEAEEKRVERNLALMTQADVTMNARNWDGFNEVHTHDVWVSTPDMPMPTETKDDHLAVVQSFVNAFPDHKIDQPYVYLFGSDDYICAVHENGGTFTEPWILPGSGATAQPNGKSFKMRMVTVATVRGDTLSREMIIYDMSDMMRQLELKASDFKMPQSK